MRPLNTAHTLHRHAVRMDDRLWLDRFAAPPSKKPIERRQLLAESASGVESLEAGFNSIEIDLFLSQDRIPMVNHDGWLIRTLHNCYRCVIGRPGASGSTHGR